MDLRALMLRQLEQIPYVKDLVKRLRRNANLRQACGYGDRAPYEAHFSQMKKRIERLMGEVSKRCKHKWEHWSTDGLRNIFILILVRYTYEALYESFKLCLYS